MMRRPGFQESENRPVAGSPIGSPESAEGQTGDRDGLLHWELKRGAGGLSQLVDARDRILERSMKG